MSGPWEDFQDSGGPWEDYAQEQKPKTFLNNLAEMVSPQEPQTRPVDGVGGFVQNLAKDTVETLTPPLNLESASRMLNPMAGQFGVSRTLQDVGQSLTDAGDAASQNLPGIVQLLYKLRPGDLTPSSAAENIGSEGLGFGFQASGLAKPVEELATSAGRRALGYTKRGLNKFGALERANEVADKMIEQGVVTPKGTEEMMTRAAEMSTKHGRRVSAIGRLLDRVGAPAFDNDRVQIKLMNELLPEYSGGAYDKETKALEEILDTVKAHGDGDISFKSAQKLKQKLGDLANYGKREAPTEIEQKARRAYTIIKEEMESGVDSGIKNTPNLSSGISEKYAKSKDLYGATREALKQLVNRSSSEAGNKAGLGLTDSIIAAGELSHGNIPGAIMAVGGKKLIEGRGPAAIARLLKSVVKEAPKYTVPGMSIVDVLKNRRKENKK